MQLGERGQILLIVGELCAMKDTPMYTPQQLQQHDSNNFLIHYNSIRTNTKCLSFTLKIHQNGKYDLKQTYIIYRS